MYWRKIIFCKFIDISAHWDFSNSTPHFVALKNWTMASYSADPKAQQVSQNNSCNSAMANEQSHFINNIYDYASNQLSNNRTRRNNAQSTKNHRRRHRNATDYVAAVEELNVIRRNQENIIRNQSNKNDLFGAYNSTYQGQNIIQRETVNINYSEIAAISRNFISLNCFGEGVNVSAIEQLAAYARRAQICDGDNSAQVIDHNRHNVELFENNCGAIGENLQKYQPTSYGNMTKPIDDLYINNELDR